MHWWENGWSVTMEEHLASLMTQWWLWLDKKSLLAMIDPRDTRIYLLYLLLYNAWRSLSVLMLHSELKLMILKFKDYFWRDQPMRSGYWNLTNERTEFDYELIKQLIPRFKITHLCNFLDLYKYQDSHYFQKSQLSCSSLHYIYFPKFQVSSWKRKVLLDCWLQLTWCKLWNNKLIRQNLRIKDLSYSLNLRIKIIRKCT